MPKWVESHPNVYKYFSIKEMECASLFPRKILDRKLYTLLPKDIRGNYPMIVVDDKVVFERPMGGYFYTYATGAASQLERV
jgi:hypothetical protein